MFQTLVVDDSSVDRFLVEATLRRHGGFEIFSAGDGREALGLCRSEGMDVVVTDLRMPEMDGIEFTQQAAVEFPDLPVILLASVPGSEALAVEAIHAGAAGYVVKDQSASRLPLLLDDVKAIAEPGAVGDRPVHSFEIATPSAFGNGHQQVKQFVAAQQSMGTMPSRVRLLLSVTGLLEWLEAAESGMQSSLLSSLSFTKSTAAFRVSGVPVDGLAALSEAVALGNPSELMPSWPPGAVLAMTVGSWRWGDDNSDLFVELPLRA